MDVDVFRFWVSLASILIVAAVQAGYPWIERRSGAHLSVLTALAGGVAVGYVALYLLPKIGDYTAAIVDARPDGRELLHYRLYYFFLGGLIFYFFIDRARPAGRSLSASLHGIAFVGYSFLTGNVLATVPRPGYFPYLLASVALALHFIGICHQLRDWHRHSFDRYLRWLIAGATLAGWAVGAIGMVSKELLAIVVAFLGGGILVNVLREEWPNEDSGRAVPFLIGVGLFLILSVVVRNLGRGPV